jgi:type III restriction enzyme
MYETEIVELIRRSSLEKFVKPKSKRQLRTLSKAVYLTPEFEAFWETISRKTTYRVSIDTEALISSAVKTLKSTPEVPALRIEITKAGLRVLRGGAKGEELGVRAAELRGSYDLPDIVSELHRGTSLTRVTLVNILVNLM